MKRYQKPSQYNLLLSYADGMRLAYNTLTRNLIELKGEQGESFESAISSPLGTSSISRDSRMMLGRLGFLVDQDINELNVVRDLFDHGRKKQNQSKMTILPTLGCNFDCPYCFERHIRGAMSPTVQDALVHFVEKCILPRVASLSIEWFGGEPLLGFSVIDSLSKKLTQVCNAAGLPSPEGSITTNGYLLAPEMVSRLMRLGVNSAQVTIDGPPEVHDRRRPLPGHIGTFQTIIANLRAVPEDFSVNIRINVDGGNKDSVFALLRILAEEKLIPKMTPYVAKVENFSEECRSSEGSFLSSEDFARFKVELRERCIAADIPWFSNELPSLVACGFCVVDNPTSFVVQPDGKLLKCWAEAGNAQGMPVGHLLEENGWESMIPSELESRDPFDDEECCQCKLLPVCMGGCPQIRRSLRKQGMKKCPPIRYSIADEVRNQYSGTQSKPTSFVVLK
jgi:uncharacterized protein